MQYNGALNTKFNIKSAPEYYKLTLQTYNKVKYISFEIFSSFCIFLSFFFFFERLMNFKRGHYLISTMLHKTIMAILYCSYQCNAISALKQSILKQNNTIAKERREREKEREKPANQPTFGENMLIKSFLEKKNLPEYQVMTDLKCNVKSFTDMNITIFRSQDFISEKFRVWFVFKIHFLTKTNNRSTQFSLFTAQPTV